MVGTRTKSQGTINLIPLLFYISYYKVQRGFYGLTRSNYIYDIVFLEHAIHRLSEEDYGVSRVCCFQYLWLLCNLTSLAKAKLLELEMKLDIPILH